MLASIDEVESCIVVVAIAFQVLVETCTSTFLCDEHAVTRFLFDRYICHILNSGILEFKNCCNTFLLRRVSY